MGQTILKNYELLLELPGDSPEIRWVGVDAQGRAVSVVEVPRDVAQEKEYLRLYHGYSRRAALLGHPGVARTIESNVDGDAYYVVTELVRGETLEALLERATQFGRTIELPSALDIISQLAEALHAAHINQDTTGKARGVVHGELGPDRVCVTYDGALKLVDLPIATASRSVRTAREGTMSGRLDYLSPEQCMGEAPDARSNVFTLGVMLWELLTGQRLYGRADAFDVMQAICDEPPQPPSRFNSQVPPFLDALVVKALAKKSEQRLSDCLQLARALRNVAARLSAGSGELRLELLLVELFSERASAWEGMRRAEEAGDKAGLLRSARALFVQGAGMASREQLAATAEMDAADEFALAALGKQGSAESAPEFPVDDAINDALSFLDSDLSAASEVNWDPQPVASSSVSVDHQPVSNEDEDLTVTQTMTESIRDDAPTTMRDVAPKVATAAHGFLGQSPEPAIPQAPEGVEHVPADLEPTNQIDIGAGPVMRPGRTEEPTELLGASPEPSTPEPVVSPVDDEPTNIASRPAPSPSPRPARAARAPEDSSRMAWYFGSDEEPDDGFHSSFAIDEIVGEVIEDQGMRVNSELEAEAVLEVIRIVGSRVMDQHELRGSSKKFQPEGATVSAKRSGARATIDPAGATGWVRPKNAQQSQRVEGGAFEMGIGDIAEINDGVFTYRFKFFYPPMAPARTRNQRPGRIIALFAIAGAASFVFHMMALFGFYLISQEVELTVKPAPPMEEIFAEGKLEELKKKVAEKPKPKPKPKPKIKPKRAKITEKKPTVDPTEQPPKVPKAVSKKLSKRLSKARSSIDRSASKSDQLAAALSSPVAGDGVTVKDVVTNMDAVKNTGSASSVSRVAGTLAGLEGNAPSIATGGGGKVGDLSKGVAGGTGKLKKRAGSGSGKVRGKVRLVKGLSKVKGNISRGDVYKEINKHMGRIQLCYERELAKNPKLGGKMNFEWVIKTNGRVSNVREKSSTLRSSKVSSCIKGVIKKMKFVKPKGGSVSIVFPFVFKSS